MNAPTTHFNLTRFETGCRINSALSFKVGALSATGVCLIGYVLYVWLVG